MAFIKKKSRTFNLCPVYRNEKKSFSIESSNRFLYLLYKKLSETKSMTDISGDVTSNTEYMW